jgi:hypothetical protein
VRPTSCRRGAEMCQLPTRIVLSNLTDWAQRSSSASRRGRSPGANGLQPAGQVLPPPLGAAAVTCPEIRWPPGFWFSGPAPSRYSQLRTGRPATECERGRVSRRGQARLTPTRRLFLRLSERRSPSADLPVRGCYRGTRCEPGCPRRNAGIGRSAVYRSVCSAGRGEWCHHVIAGCQGACWRALFEPGVRLTRRRDCGPRAP